MVITICAIIAGADDWNAIETFGNAKKPWFETFLELNHGIPSYDTFRRFFSLLSATTFQDFFTDWIKDMAECVDGVIAIEGKTLRKSHDHRLGKPSIW